MGEVEDREGGEVNWESRSNWSKQWSAVSMLELMCELLGELVWSASGVDQKFYSGEDFSSKVKLSSTTPQISSLPQHHGRWLKEQLLSPRGFVRPTTPLHY